MAGFVSFDEKALLAILEGNYSVRRQTARGAEPTLLQLAKVNCGTQFPGDPTRNPAPGTVHGESGVYRRSGVFVDTLELTVTSGGGVADLEFSSPATSFRKGYGSYAYGQALIEGWEPFIGPYRLLPEEFYSAGV